ncbi:unnamed protein product [Rhizophagus irregularis]|nr:unnamed protein product [Rhizophagus irregularis]
MEYQIENVDNLKKKCEEAMKIVPSYGDFTKNYFSIKREKFNDVITQWQTNYPDLYSELEQWKKVPGLFTHEINYPKPSKITKVRNIIFKRKSEKIFNELLKSHSKTMAALILGLKISWK